ncbi:MAG: bifunctional aldolase/short-chain dehydrogenase [Gammaproteobacteria bacterium]|nr:bifunctional aldolase/short-chain dehydrogenase [Gammaproteobacteria bacterium]
MQSLWNDSEARGFLGDLSLRVYTSRLLGQDPSLVLHGGGNTSVKIRERNCVDEEEEILYVKGSGWDLATIEEAGFAPVRMAHMLKLARLPSLSDPAMVNELRTQMTRASAPTPSVETILHAILPFKYVDHTHADAVITVSNTQGGLERIREIYGDSVVIIPYTMPGFDLARAVAQRFPEEAGPNTIGMVLMNHGVFSFAETARESYERMIALVNRAEQYLRDQGAWDLEQAGEFQVEDGYREPIAELRQGVSEQAGRPMLLWATESAKGLSYSRRADVAEISGRGPVTPDHVIRTKRVAMVGRDLAGYGVAYRAYFDEHASRGSEPKTMLDTAPRVILDDRLGLCTVGRTARDAAIVADIYDHTMDCVLRAEKLGGWRALPPGDIFEVEYWDLEQAKLAKGGLRPPFEGEIAMITGAASGIGAACVGAFLDRGAAVVALDREPAVLEQHSAAAYLGIQCDVTDQRAVALALERGVRRFGGLDMLVLNAGVFPGGRLIAELSMDEWRRVLSLNLDANLALLRECHGLLKRAPRGGRVVVMGSKNVPAPGPGAAAYSASKAALNQLARIAALEWGAESIRVNSIHPDAVFDTALWTDDVLEARASHYGMSVAQYKTKNLLRTEVTSRDVARMAAEMCGDVFAKTTGAQVPLDGGNDRVV